MRVLAVQQYFGLAAKAIRFTFARPFYIGDVIQQMDEIGVQSLGIVLLTGFFTGMVLALQTSVQMAQFGATMYIGRLVNASMVRELGPVLAAILVAGRVGSAITAELASMKVYQEVDALITMNIPPERMLVLPRLAAILVMMPILTLIGIICGWYGGALICQYTHFISIDSETYFAALKRYMDWRDITDGLLKAEVFGFVIVLVCCHIGLNTRGGPREIGASVTKAVVTSLILILVLDYFVTKALI